MYYNCITDELNVIVWISDNSYVPVYSFLSNQTVISQALHTTMPQYDLMEFFDNKDNWGAKSVKVGKINLYAYVSNAGTTQFEVEYNIECYS